MLYFLCFIDWIIFRAHHLRYRRKRKCLLTRNNDGGPGVNDATVWTHAVPARCGRLDFETHIPICGVGELQSGSDDICERALGSHR